MKNKSLTYVLLIVVAIVWYNVFFRVASNFGGEDIELVESHQTTQKIRSIDRDTFSLDANYRDPFGNTILVRTQSLNPQLNLNPIPAPKPIIQKIKEPWPTIQYKGMLRKTSSINPLAIIYIDGIQLYMHKGEQAFDGIFLKTIHRDSVVISYQKSRRTFWRD